LRQGKDNVVVTSKRGLNEAESSFFVTGFQIKSVEIRIRLETQVLCVFIRKYAVVKIRVAVLERIKKLRFAL
jgi:hypothetical protein